MASYLGGSQLLSPNLGNKFTNMDVFGRVQYSEGDSDESITPVEEKLKVFLRIKPWDILCVNDTINTSNYKVDGKKLITKCTNLKREEVTTFQFTDVYLPSTTQEVIYENVVKRNLKSFLLGENCLIFAYGTSNSGKSYTMQGTGLNPGIIPRVLYSIFNSISGNEDVSGKYYPDGRSTIIVLNENQIAFRAAYKEKLLAQFAKESRKKKKNLRQNQNDTIRCTSHEEMEVSLKTMPKMALPKENNAYSIWLSFAEIYNEALYDLLVDAHEQQPLYLAEEADKNNYIKGLKHINVHSWQEAYDLYRYGKNNLHIAQTVLNKQSSRSHCLFTIKIVAKDIGSDDIKYISSFTICDLAGSERQNRAGTEATMRCKEAQCINMSLLVLNRCIDTMRKNQQIKGSLRIPFRESKLTRLFMNFLTGEGRISMVANMSQDPTLFFETEQVLKMTADAYQIKIIASNPNAFQLKIKERGCNQEGVVQKNQFIGNKTIAVCRRCDEYKKINKKLQTDLKNKEEALEFEKNSRRLLDESISNNSNIVDAYKLNYEILEDKYNSYKNKTDKKLSSCQKQIDSFEAKRDNYIEILQEALEADDTSLNALIHKACQKIKLLELMMTDFEDGYEKFLNVDHQALLNKNAELEGRVSYLEEEIKILNLFKDNIPEENQARDVITDMDFSFDGNQSIFVIKKQTMLKAKEGENLRCTTKETSNYCSPAECFEVTQEGKYLSLEEIQVNENLSMETTQYYANLNPEEIQDDRNLCPSSASASCSKTLATVKKYRKNILPNDSPEKHLDKVEDNENLNKEETQDDRNLCPTSASVSCSKTPATVKKSKKNILPDLSPGKHLDKVQDNAKLNQKEIQGDRNLCPSSASASCSKTPATVKKYRKNILPNDSPEKHLDKVEDNENLNKEETQDDRNLCPTSASVSCSKTPATVKKSKKNILPDLSPGKHLDKVQDNAKLNQKEIQGDRNLCPSSASASCSKTPATVKKSKKNIVPNLSPGKHLDKVQDNANLNQKEIQGDRNLCPTSASPSCSKTSETVKKSRKKLLCTQADYLGDTFVPQETAESVVLPSPGSVLSSLRPRKKKE